jgi:Sec-independent protein translocase protein TatA
LSILEIGIILVVALVVIGPEKLPEVLVALGRLMRELRLASNTVLRELTSTADDVPAALRPYRPPQAGSAPVSKAPETITAADAPEPPEEPKPSVPET